MIRLIVLTTYWRFLRPICSAFDRDRFPMDEGSSSEAEWLVQGMMKRERWIRTKDTKVNKKWAALLYPHTLESLARAWHVTGPRRRSTTGHKIGDNASEHMVTLRVTRVRHVTPLWSRLSKIVQLCNAKVLKLMVLSLRHLSWCWVGVPWINVLALISMKTVATTFHE